MKKLKRIYPHKQIPKVRKTGFPWHKEPNLRFTWSQSAKDVAIMTTVFTVVLGGLFYLLFKTYMLYPK